MGTEAFGNQSGPFFRLNPPREPQTIEERWQAQKTEGAIDPTPSHGNAPDGATDMGEREHKHTRDHAGLNDPDISNRIPKRPDKENRDDDVSERQPIRAIRNPRVFGIRITEAVANDEEPVVEARRGRMQNAASLGASTNERFQLAQERKGRDAAQ